jgi:hypothetical protein
MSAFISHPFLADQITDPKFVFREGNGRNHFRSLSRKQFHISPTFRPAMDFICVIYQIDEPIFRGTGVGKKRLFHAPVKTHS